MPVPRIKIDKRGLPSCFLYRGLMFPLWRGRLTNSELKTGEAYFAYYGGGYLTERVIRYKIDQMVEQGLYVDRAA